MKRKTSTSPVARRRAIAAVAAVVAASAAAWLTADPATRREWTLDAAEAGYAVFDPWSEPARPALGPGAAGTEADGGGVDQEALAAAIAAAWPGGAEVTVAVDQPPAVRPLPFRYENTRAPAFAAFAADLRAALGGQIPDDPFALCDAVRRLAPHGTPGDDPGDDPAACLAAATGGGPLLCHHVSALTAHALLATGRTARVLGLSDDGGTFDHAVLEFYSPANRAWVLLDPDFNLAYRRAGGEEGSEWLSAADLHRAAADLHARGLNARDAAVVRREAGIEAVVLGDAAAPLRASHLRADGPADAGRRSLAGLFRTVFYAARNDRLTSSYPPGHPDRVRQYVLWDGTAGELPPACPEGERLDAAATGRLYAPLGGVRFSFREISPGGAAESSAGVRLALDCRTFLPGFDRFRRRRGDGEFEPTPPAFSVPLRLGENRLAVRAVAHGGRVYPASTLRIAVRPASDAPASSASTLSSAASSSAVTTGSPVPAPTAL